MASGDSTIDSAISAAPVPQVSIPSSATLEPTAEQAAAVQVEASDDAAGHRKLFYGMGACMLSSLLHVVALVLLGLLIVQGAVDQSGPLVVAEIVEETELEDELSVELEQDLEAATTITDAEFSSAPEILGAAGEAGAPDSVTLDSKVFEQDTPDMRIESPVMSMPSAKKLIEAVPDGALGDPRAIVGDYQEALDRITREIMWMLDRNEVLVVWCFDQSNSMKDDQQEIKKRIDRIYQELGLLDTASDERLLTSVVSYGKGFVVHTPKPTSDLKEIRKAIDVVPIDESGEEIMCEAVGRAIANYREFARKGKRKMALILVSDESGNRENNYQYLEQAIAEAKASKCTVFALGREAVFGYPKAFMRWRHPQTNRVHWLPVDRGPETGFVEQLQTNGFRRRHDAFSSGFGPYELTRLCRESGGIYFMLPTIEKDIVQRYKAKYELEAMYAYLPDLRSRLEVMTDRDNQPLRALLWKVIADLDPYNEAASRVVEMRMAFALDRGDFVKQARTQQQKAKLFLQYLHWAQTTLEENRELRDQEISPRWQANYDLMLAQIVAYQARLYEYGAALEDFIKDPQTAPATKKPNLRLVHWDIGTTKDLRREEESRPYIDRSMQLFQEVIKQHPGTPWAARAQWELRRGFGVRLVPDYDPPYKKVANPMPVPKL